MPTSTEQEAISDLRLYENQGSKLHPTDYMQRACAASSLFTSLFPEWTVQRGLDLCRDGRVNGMKLYPGTHIITHLRAIRRSISHGLTRETRPTNANPVKSISWVHFAPAAAATTIPPQRCWTKLLGLESGATQRIAPPMSGCCYQNQV